MDEDRCISLLESSMRNKPREAFLIFDAMDECPEIDHDSNEVRSKITTAMKRLAIVGRLFITARPHVHPATVIPDCHRLEIRATDPDMRCYIDARIKGHKRLLRLVGSDPQLANRLNGTLCQKANGMFLLTRLQLDSLVNQTSARHVSKALESLPDKLSKTFGDAIDRIKSQSQEYWRLARKVISWISYAKRPLKISELREILAVEPRDTKFDPSGLHERDLILEVCCGLVSIDEQDETVRLVHYSLQEYLTTCLGGHWPEAEEIVAATCLAYLTLEDFSVKPLYYAMPAHCWFISYAGTYWGEHVRGPFELKLEDRIFQVLENTRLLQYIHRYQKPLYKAASRTTPLHIIASLGLNYTMSVLMKYKIDLEDRDSNDYTPLGRAVQAGESTAVLQLLDRGADPEAESGGMTPFFIACAGKDLATLELLLDYGAICDARALASSMIDATVLQWLLNKVCFKDEDKLEALLTHVQYGRVNAVQVLLRAGANANSIDNESGDTALTIAIYHHQYDIIAYLLAAGAEPSIMNRRGDIPFHMAVYLRREPAIDALIDANADPDLLDIYGRSCLDLAYPDENLLNKLGGELATYVPTDPIVKERRIREGIMDILRSIYTVWWRRNSDALKQPGLAPWMLGTLGHCLLLIGESADARTCFEYQTSTISCDGCPGDRRLRGKRFVCGSCADTDLCEPCMSLQKSQAPPLSSCRNHEFLEVTEPWLAKYEDERVNDAGETFREWLTRLAQCYLNGDDYIQLKNELDADDNKLDGQVEEPEVKESEVKESEVKESEVKESEVKESEVKESEVKESEVKESEVKESEVKESEVTEAD